MSTVYAKYRLFCITEGKYVTTDWRTAPPTVCPHFMTDTINTSSIVVISQFTQQSVNVAYSNAGTQGKWQALGYSITAPIGVSTSTITLPPYPLRISSTQLLANSANVGDSISLYTEPGTTAGALAAAAAIGNTVLQVTPSTVSALFLGYQLTVGADVVGLVVALDSTNYTVTISQPLSSAYPNATVVKYSVLKISNLTLSNTPVSIGGDNFGEIALPANSPLSLSYINNGSTSKMFSLLLSVMY